MSNTLVTKAIMLDETGQAIVEAINKLSKSVSGQKTKVIDKLYEASTGAGAPLTTDITYLSGRLLSDYDLISVCLSDPTTFTQGTLTQVDAFNPASLIVDDAPINAPVGFTTANDGVCYVHFKDDCFRVVSQSGSTDEEPSVYSIYGIKVGGSTIEITPSLGSGTKVADYEIDGVAGAIYVPTAPTALSQLSDDSTHRLVTDTEKTTWNGKQNALTFDNVPTASSNNPVKSGGVYTALSSKANTSDVNASIADINNTIDDVIDELSDPETTYLLPKKNYSGKYAYPVVSNNKLYLADTSLSGIRCACYELSAGTTYTINYKTQSTLLFGWAVCETYVDNPSSGNVYVGLYTDAQIDTAQTYGKHESTYTPNSNCYLYLNIAADETLNPDNAVSYLGSEISVYTKSEIDDMIEEVENTIDKSKGVYFDGSAYHHFVKNADDTYVVQKFENKFGNNLLQLSELYLGNFVNGALVKISNFGEIGSDIVGPFGIASSLNGTSGYTGGVHTVKIDNVNYPTAVQKSLVAKVNGNAINSVGIYYGTLTIEVINWLYFADEITGNNLDQLNRAVTETRRYTLTDSMNVEVIVKADRTFYIGSYYGCQIIPVGMTEILLPNAQKKIVFSDMSDSYEMQTKESIFKFSNGTYNYDVSVEPIGLGEMTHTTKGYGLVTNNANHKTYFYLSVADTVPHRYEVTQGEYLVWRGKYHYYKK